MKYKNLLMFAALCAAPLSVLAAETDHRDYYAGIRGGASFPEDIKDQVVPGFVAITFGSNVDYNVGAFVGKEFGNFRGELEFTYRQNDTDVTAALSGHTDLTKVELPSYSGMVNGYYDWRNSSQFTPYIGVGTGIIYIKPHNFTTPDFSATAKNASRWGTQLMAGVNTDITEKISVGVGYRFIEAPSAQEIFAPTHEVYASVAFKF